MARAFQLSLMSHGSIDPAPAELSTERTSSDPSLTGVGTSVPATGRTGTRLVVLTGNPNSGKTTIFNALTGLRERVGNYGGVTVEHKTGRLGGMPGQESVQLLDVPGTYSLIPHSPDERIARDVLLNRTGELEVPDAVVIVVDASNLQRNLYYATQVLELGYPSVVALNMLDLAEGNGYEIDAGSLAAELGVPVVPVVASEAKGLSGLKQAIADTLREPPRSPRLYPELPPAVLEEVRSLASALAPRRNSSVPARIAEALLIVTDSEPDPANREAVAHPDPAALAIARVRQRLTHDGRNVAAAAIEARHRTVAAITGKVTRHVRPPAETQSDKIDRVITHKVWGSLIFVGIMVVMFQSIFTFAQIPMAALERAVDWLGQSVTAALPPGDLQSLLVEGVVAGVGAVVVFLPQILLLFLFIGFLEDTGYMARAALVMDRLMSRVGLHGKSFIPMLSSFACAIPGIMATRTIESRADRMVTILVAPLMSCSARLPVYTLLIASSIPDIRVLGFLKLTALTMLGMYMLGIVAALGMAWVFKRTLLKGDAPLFIMELPPYKRPVLRVVLRQMWDRSFIFLKQAGTIILGINIVLWFLAAYPKDSQSAKEFDTRRAALQQDVSLSEAERLVLVHSIDGEEAGHKLRNSFAGRMGRAIEPFIAPLGFDWKIGIGIITSFAAREVFVSTMSTVYNVGNADEGGESGLAKNLKGQTRDDGSPVYTVRTSLALMVFYVFALQCVSTVAVVKRETQSWRWPVFQWLYLGALAWAAAFLVYQLGGLLGLV